MARNRDRFTLDELQAERERLQADVEKHRFRLHRLPELTRRLKTVTTELLRLEAQAACQKKQAIEPLGDVRPCQRRLPYVE
ncbi:hypothetical protein [Roseibium sp.]|uniref:hypothetical protein n=1 Tax=Roseibium sp. TaxID=1936156 RepID=UPI0032669F70